MSANFFLHVPISNIFDIFYPLSFSSSCIQSSHPITSCHLLTKIRVKSLTKYWKSRKYVNLRVRKVSLILRKGKKWLTKEKREAKWWAQCSTKGRGALGWPEWWSTRWENMKIDNLEARSVHFFILECEKLQLGF